MSSPSRSRGATGRACCACARRWACPCGRTPTTRGLARTHAALPLAAADFTALLLGEAVCAPDAYGVNAAVPRTLVRWLIAAEAERAEEPLRTELRAALSAPDADCAGVPCALTDFCFYHLIRCGAHPRRILRLARAAFGDAATDADVLRAMAALTRCLFRRPAALPAHVTLGAARGRCAGHRTRPGRSGATRSTPCAGSCPETKLPIFMHKCISCRRLDTRSGGVLRMKFAFLCISPKESRFLREFYSKKGLTFARKR